MKATLRHEAGCSSWPFYWGDTLAMSLDELALYDQTRLKLHGLLADRLPNDVDVDAMTTAYAYWVCTIVRRHQADWEATVHNYAERAVRDAMRENEAEQRELDRLAAALRTTHATGKLLDIGAGWGRLSEVCNSLGWQTFSLEPTALGTHLLRRHGHARTVQATGEVLPFPAATFPAVLIGWVLHHDAPDLDAARMMHEAARVTAPGGCLISIEPLSAEFDRAKWLWLLDAAGFAVRSAEDFYTMPQASGGTEQYALAVGVRQ
jgi:SAM-dependent methyltransferase